MPDIALPSSAAHIQLLIDFDPSSGQVNLAGPLDNRMLCYALIDMAKEIMLMQALTKASESRIVVPQVVPTGNLRQS